MVRQNSGHGPQQHFEQPVEVDFVSGGVAPQPSSVEPNGVMYLDDELSSDIGYASDGNPWPDGLDDLIEPEGPPTAEEQRSDLLMTTYVQPYRHTGISPAEAAAWYAGLDPGKQALYADIRRENIEAHERQTSYEPIVRAGLLASAPSLLEGRLPHKQAERLSGEYILGSNQSGCDTIDDASAYLAANEEVSMSAPNGTMSPLDHRFLWFDTFPDQEERAARAHIERAVIEGYYGEDGGGKFIVAVPSDATLRKEQGINSVAEPHRLPGDFFKRNTRGGIVINDKYLTGFIDIAGSYARNSNFMVRPGALLEPVAA